MRITVAKLLLAGGLFSVAFSSTAAGVSEPFDKPLRKRVLDMGRSQYLMRSDNRHVTVTCWYYRNFMIKEKNDPGMKGAEFVALTPTRRGRFLKCLSTLQPDEKEFKDWIEEYKAFANWNGYFAGVKHDLIFLERPDGDDNSGIPFTAFGSDTKTKVFEDSVMLEARGERHLNFLPTSDHQIVIRYLRVASAGCSIPRSGDSCWRNLQHETGLVHSTMPRCTDYEGAEAGVAASVIAYPVEATLYPNPLVRPVGGPIRCYPQQ